MTQLAHELDGTGAAPPLVLLHALGGDMRMWDACRALWEGHRKVVAYDRSAAGRSPTPDRDYSIDDHVAELEALRSELGLATIIPVGNAIGALVAAAYTATYPERVRALVLIDPAVVRGRAPGPSLIEERIARVAEGGMAAILPEAVDRAFHEQPHDERYRAYLERFAHQDPEAYIHSMRSCLDADLSAMYPEIACPVLILVGEHDLLFPPAEAERVAALVADDELHVLDGVAHFPPYQAPERVADLITTFADASTAPADSAKL